MHDGPMGNDTTPGQNAPPTNYSSDIATIAEILLAFNQSSPSKIVFVATTPYLCSAASDGCVQTLNNEAIAVMNQYGIPVISAYNAIVNQCGGVIPVQTCFGETGCFCPHCMNFFIFMLSFCKSGKVNIGKAYRYIHHNHSDNNCHNSKYIFCRSFL